MAPTDHMDDKNGKKRLWRAFKAGKEIAMVDRGTDRLMMAFEYPYIVKYVLAERASVEGEGLAAPRQDTTRVRCFWYNGNKKLSAVFNLENITLID